MQLIVKPAAFTLAVVLLVSAGCGAVTPSPSPPLLPTAVATRSPAITASLSAALSPTPSGSVAPAVVDLPLDIHEIPPDDTAHITAVISTGSEILWSGGEQNGHNNLYRYVPGDPAPELLFRNPRPDSYLTTIAGSTSGYVFADVRLVEGEPRGWRLWYLAAAGAEPVLLDQSTDDRLPSPTLSMSDRYICWEVVRGTVDSRTNELRFATTDNPSGAVTLISNPGRDTYIEDPSLWADELWYGFVENDWDAGAEYPRVEMIDLANRTAAPVVFGEDQRAFMPAPGRDIVAWKSGGEDGLSALNSGALTIYRRDSGRTQMLPAPGPSRLAERISYPSVGNRFIAWWDDIKTRFYVYDLGEEQFRRIAEYEATGEELVTRPSVSGDLIAWVHSRDENHRTLEWAWLPD